MSVTLRDDGKDGILGLNGKVEGSLLEGQKISRVETRACSLWEDPNSRLSSKKEKKKTA